MAAERSGARGPVLRLRVRYADGKWSVVKRLRVPTKRLPPSHVLPTQARISGFWYEAVGPKGVVLYRRSVPDPTEPSMEVRDEGGGLKRARAVHTDVTFDVIVPDLPGLTEIRLFSSTAGSPHPEREGLARHVATLALREADGGGGYGGE